MVIPSGLSRLRTRVPAVVADAENGLTALARELINDLYGRLQTLDEQVTQYDRRIEQVFKRDERCQRLAEVEGLGPLIATAFLAAVGDARVFAQGRQVAAWVGLVPKQASSGGKVRLGSSSKRGDCYLRTLPIQGARAAVQAASLKSDPRSPWIKQLRDRRGKNVATVALAHKNARVLWALLVTGQPYRPAASSQAVLGYGAVPNGIVNH